MKWPAPTRSAHQAFCEKEGWEQVRNARGKTSGHHALTYELHLPGGTVLRTRISHPPDGSNYGPSMWAHILRDQLSVDEDTFWACVRDGRKPARSQPIESEEALPADLAYLLVTRVGLTRDEIASLTRDEAVARAQQYWTEGH